MAIGFQVTFDAHDPAKLAEFWALALEYQIQPPPPGYGLWSEFAVSLGLPADWDGLGRGDRPSGNGPCVLFRRVPEGKTAKNRVHLDINVCGRASPGARTAGRWSPKCENPHPSSIAHTHEERRHGQSIFRLPFGSNSRLAEGNNFSV